MAASLGDLFRKGGIGEQLVVWDVLGVVLSTVLAPAMQLLTREVNKVLPGTPLTPAQLSDMVVRHIVEMAAATAYARESGIDETDFERMVQSAGEGPAPGDLAEALRRGIIQETGAGADETSFEQGLAESHLRDKWAPVVKLLAVREPTPADALRALLQGQIEEQRARDLYQRFGGDPQHFDWLFDSEGSAPTPLEAISMANRGIIPWDGRGPDTVSYEQAFLEGPWRDKWADPYRAFGTYVAPPRTVTALVRSGALTDQQAIAEFQKQGMTREMATAMLTDAHHVKTAAHRDLARGDILGFYRDGVVSRDDATAMLGAMGDTKEDVALLLDLEDVRREVAAVNGAISRVHGYYVARRIEAADASNDLDALRVPAAQRDQLLATWEVERASNLKTLSAAEITSAFFYNLIDQETAQQLLVADGYSPGAAWILLSVRKHTPLPNPPAGVQVPARG